MAQVELDKYLTIEDELTLEADEVRLAIDKRGGMAKVEMLDVHGNLLSVLQLDADELYELAHKMLRGYDQLEGL